MLYAHSGDIHFEEKPDPFPRTRGLGSLRRGEVVVGVWDVWDQPMRGFTCTEMNRNVSGRCCRQRTTRNAEYNVGEEVGAEAKKEKNINLHIYSRPHAADSREPGHRTWSSLKAPSSFGHPITPRSSFLWFVQRLCRLDKHDGNDKANLPFGVYSALYTQ